MYQYNKKQHKRLYGVISKISLMKELLLNLILLNLFLKLIIK